MPSTRDVGTPGHGSGTVQSAAAYLGRDEGVHGVVHAVLVTANLEVEVDVRLVRPTVDVVQGVPPNRFLGNRDTATPSIASHPRALPLGVDTKRKQQERTMVPVVNDSGIRSSVMPLRPMATNTRFGSDLENSC